MATIYTYKNLQDEVLSWLDEAGDTGTTLTNVKNALNRSHQQRLMAAPWPFLLWPQAETFSTASGTRVYTLHSEFWRPEYLYNRNTSTYLVETPTRNLPSTGDRWPSDTGRTVNFRYGPTSPVAAQPSSASVVTLVSSSAGDTTAAKALTIYGISSGAYTSESLTPTGTTPVVGTTSFSTILGITKGAAWTGTATLTANGGTVTLLTLLPAEYGRVYQTVEFLRTPTAVDVIEYRFYRQPRTLTADNDIPDIPNAHAQLLVWDTLLLFAGYNTDLSEKSIGVWVENQRQAKESLEREWLEPRTLEGAPKYIRDIDHDDNVPRIFS